MKRFFVVSLIAAVFVTAMTTSCSMQSMTFKNLEKKGYVVGQFTPDQQREIAPLMNAFPALNLTALAYLASDYSVSYLYEGNVVDWTNYGLLLRGAGFSSVGSGFVKADRATGITYNVSYKFVDKYLTVTFTSAAL